MVFKMLLIMIFCFPSFLHAARYMTVEAGMKSIVPNADRFIKTEITLSPAELSIIFSTLGSRFKRINHTIYTAMNNGNRIARGMVLNVKGKERPITFLIVVNMQGQVDGVEVLAYRESQGDEIRHRRFLRQFTGKTVKNRLKMNSDIDAISGATLSSRAAVYAVKKGLAIMSVISTGEGLK